MPKVNFHRSIDARNTATDSLHDVSRNLCRVMGGGDNNDVDRGNRRIEMPVDQVRFFFEFVESVELSCTRRRSTFIN